MEVHIPPVTSAATLVQQQTLLDGFAKSVTLYTVIRKPSESMKMGMHWQAGCSIPEGSSQILGYKIQTAKGIMARPCQCDRGNRGNRNQSPEGKVTKPTGT
jgi:hypothetical protein